MRLFLTLLVAAIALGPSLPRTAHAGTREAVYVNLADSLQGSFDELSGSLRGAFGANGWQVIATHDVAVERCTHKSRLFVLHNADYARQVLAKGPRAAFALPPRLLLYEDERGTHLATINARSINRTIVAESGFEAPSDFLLRELARVASGAVHERFVSHPYGQLRDQGLIGRTMGVMAGGPFPEKLDVIHSAPGSTPAEIAAIAAKVWKGIEQGGKGGRWQIGGIYQLDLSAQGVWIIGVSGAALEAKSFAIVGAGSESSRSGFKCPGTSHALAYPIEIVIFAEQGRVNVVTVDGMYRMKMYFEDAGKMKFAANMGMPGSVEDEIRALALAGLGVKR